MKRFFRRKRNKYRVAPKDQRTYKGRVYASMAEMLYLMDVLEPLCASGSLASVDGQTRLTLGIPENVYVPDFACTRRDGSVYYVDVKGVETEKFRHNKRLWKVYGPAPLHIVKRTRSGWKTTIIPAPKPRKATT